MFAGCPLVWTSKLQMHIALLSTKAEYLAHSTAMCELKDLLKQLDSIRWSCMASNELHSYYSENNISGVDPATGSPTIVIINFRISL
jgi:hypothetical protein